MTKPEFEWDADRAALNGRRHGVSFEHAATACHDPFAVEWIDERQAYGEERVNLLGPCQGTILHVTDTERDDRIRIISARRAERHEQDHYFRENAT